jgi:hypothetical protein
MAHWIFTCPKAHFDTTNKFNLGASSDVLLVRFGISFRVQLMTKRRNFIA